MTMGANLQSGQAIPPIPELPPWTFRRPTVRLSSYPTEKEILSSPRITFCISCRDRLWQLKETLPFNLRRADGQHTFSLVDYGSSDGMAEWVWSNFSAEIRSGLLTFFEVRNEVSWSSPKSKNLAHRLAAGDYLFNLDADNWIEAKDLEKIWAVAKTGRSSHQFSGERSDGSYGRIGLARSQFYALGGYDEALLPIAVQDKDLLRRLALRDHGPVKLGAPARQAIMNTVEQKMAQLPPGVARTQDQYVQMKRINNQFSRMKLDMFGPERREGFSTSLGLLNGEPMIIDGLNLRHPVPAIGTD
jgi:hypothetical protein